MGTTAGVRELRSKLAGLSGSRASMLMVRQLMLAMLVIQTIACGMCARLVARGVGRRQWSCGEVAIRRAGGRGVQLSPHRQVAAATFSADNVWQHNQLSHKQGSPLETDRYQHPHA